jgi:hypothetical protein
MLVFGVSTNTGNDALLALERRYVAKAPALINGPLLLGSVLTGFTTTGLRMMIEQGKEPLYLPFEAT